MTNQTSPRVVACIDNRVGYEVLRHVVESRSADVVHAVIHPPQTISYGDEIRSFCDAHGIPTSDVERARRDFDAVLAGLQPDYLLSIYFDYILDDRFLTLPAKDAINLHPGYLPYNKGFYYYVWSVLDGTPAGVSLHRMTATVDNGDVIAQARVLVDPTDDGESLYRKHEDESIRLFKGTWASVLSGSYRVHRQRHGGTRHKLRETKGLLALNPHEPTTAMELIDRLRVTTFRGKAGCTIDLGGRTYQLSLTMTELEGAAAPLPGKHFVPTSDNASEPATPLLGKA